MHSYLSGARSLGAYCDSFNCLDTVDSVDNIILKSLNGLKRLHSINKTRLKSLNCSDILDSVDKYDLRHSIGQTDWAQFHSIAQKDKIRLKSLNHKYYYSSLSKLKEHNKNICYNLQANLLAHIVTILFTVYLKKTSFMKHAKTNHPKWKPQRGQTAIRHRKPGNQLY